MPEFNGGRTRESIENAGGYFQILLAMRSRELKIWGMVKHQPSQTKPRRGWRKIEGEELNRALLNFPQLSEWLSQADRKSHSQTQGPPVTVSDQSPPAL
jgi:hypothetical protein